MMDTGHKLGLIAAYMVMQLCFPLSVQSQQPESIKAFAKGHGSIVSADEKRNITAVLVLLQPNGTAQITLISDLQLHAEATWSVSDSSSEEILLKITGGELSGNASGSGKLVLSNDKQSIRELVIKAKLFDGRELTLKFVAEGSESLRQEHVDLVLWPSLY